MSTSYPTKVWRLFREPRRAGRLEDRDGVLTGRARTPAGHAELLLQLRLAADGRIEEARFLALGCPYLIATGGWLCSHLTGRRRESAQELEIALVVEQLELPAVKRYCAVMALEAVQAALAAEAGEAQTNQETDQEHE